MTDTQKPVLIAYSGYGQPDDLERSKKAGFTHYLVKPISADAIHNLIKSMKLGSVNNLTATSIK